MYEHAMARYGLAVATTIVATALSLAVRPLVHATPSPPFIVSVLLTAWLGGIGPALLATLLAAVSLDLVTAPRLQALSVGEEAITRVVVFVIVAIAVGAMAAARRRAEQTTQIARAEAEAANRQKDEFVSMLAHELRTPLPSYSARRTPSRIADSTRLVPHERWLRFSGTRGCRLASSATRSIWLE